MSAAVGSSPVHLTVRHLFFLVVTFLAAHSAAHSGFDTLAWGDSAGAYKMSVLADFHVTSERTGSQSQLFVQLSDGEEVAPADTQVSAVIRLRDEVIYEGAVPFVADGSTGGTVYRGYLLTLPLSADDVYEVDLAISGSLGAAGASYGVKSRGGGSLLELLPSALILFISLGGFALLFLPVKRKDTPHEVSSQPVSSHKS